MSIYHFDTVNSNINGTSDNFAIFGAPITVINPNNLSLWDAGSQQSITWNASGTEDIALYHNGTLLLSIVTNIGVNGSGTGSYFWTLPNNLLDGTYMICIMDHANTTISNYSEGFTISAVAPTISNLLLSPLAPTNSMPLQLTYLFADFDGLPENGTQIQWYRNNILQSGLNNFISVPITYLVKGDQWYAELQPYNGEDFGNWSLSNTITIVNSPPTATNVTLSPSSPFAIDQISINYTYHDNDSDPAGSPIILWYLNGILQPQYTNLTILPSFASTGEDVWYAILTPYDGFAFGQRVQTANITVLINYIPTINTCPQNMTYNQWLVSDVISFNFMVNDSTRDVSPTFSVWYSGTLANGTEIEETILLTNQTWASGNLTIVSFDPSSFSLGT